MHWFFYIVAGLVTALAIYIQMKRFDQGKKEDEQPDKGAPPAKGENGGT